jgi:NADPH:quinone reductase-like Zn-dependent oxidoreductase
VQAVVFTDQARIALAQRPEPVAGDGEVLIEVGAVGICGTDLHAPLKPAIFTPGVILGHEFAGTRPDGQPVVVNPIALSCGNCDACRRGFTNQCLTALAGCSGVARDGGMAQFAVADRRSIHEVPCGAGQAVAPSGVDRIDRTYDVVFDCTGAAEAFPNSLALVAPGGRVVMLGSYPAPIGVDHIPHEASVVFSSVYMGWAYDTALYGYFHLNPLDLGISVVEYMLVSLSLFSPFLLILVTVFMLISAARTWHPNWSRMAPFLENGKLWTGRALTMGLGAVLTVAAMALILTAGYIGISTYVVLGMLAAGAILLTWPNRADGRGRFPYAVAIVVAAVCVLWGGSLYATHLGQHAAEHIWHNMSARTAVTLYATGPLGLSGPQVSEQTLPAGSLYRYRYQGLRLLTMRSGSYYLLPAGWSPQHDHVYVINDTDQVRIELS